MPIDIDSALGNFPQTLTLRARRAEVLASNLANADTPNYKARDIDFKQALSQAQGQTTLRATNPAHMQPTEQVGGYALAYRVPTQASLDGNTVEMHHEQAEFSRNAVEYQTALTFLSGRIKSLMGAIRGE